MTARLTEPSPDVRAAIERRFVWVAAFIAVLLAALPALYALVAAPKGSTFIGFEYNTDDHLVYAAWMRQAMDGRFFFDNRFTTDAQPSLTVNLYFWALGIISKLTGIPLAANLARLLFTGLFVPLLYRLVRRITPTVFATRMTITVVVLGGGIGFLVWHNFGQAIVRPVPSAISSMMLGQLPVDVWQPEAFVFPSMLTNGLFMVSLCLILVIFQSFLDARDGWRPVLIGALAIAVLMNIHSYDVLIIAFVMVGFATMQAVSRDLNGSWLSRGLVIGSGAVLPALWFVHVLKSDPVFQARAATETYSASFIQIFFGYVLMFVLVLPGLFMQLKQARQRAGLVLFSTILLGLLAAAYSGVSLSGGAYFLGPVPWLIVAIAVLVSLGLMASERPALNLIIAWAVMGLVALYFPALFQRKLAMGLSIPWAILAAMGFVHMVRNQEKSARNLVSVLVTLLFAGTSFCWIARRDLYLIRHDVSNTTVHPVFLSRDETDILRILNKEADSRRVVALAMPGVASPSLDESGNPVPDEYTTPAIPDLNPIVSGIAGVYTYAGHWSETPDYSRRRNEAATVFRSQTSEAEREAILAKIRPDYLIAPSPEAYGNAVANLDSLGDVVFTGSQFRLIRMHSWR